MELAKELRWIHGLTNMRRGRETGWSKPTGYAPVLLLTGIWKEEGTAQGHHSSRSGELLDITATANCTTTILQSSK